MAKWIKPEEYKKYDLSRDELYFNELLEKNGFKVLSVRIWQSKTDYMIEKDGIKFKFDYHHIKGTKEQGRITFVSLSNYFSINKEYLEKVGK